MDYTNWPQIQQNPNPNPEYRALQIPNHSVGYPQIPYQPPNVDPRGALYPPPQIQPPGVAPPFVPPPGAVSFMHQPIAPPPVAVSYAHQPIAYEAQQSADAAAAAAAAAAGYYQDPKAAAATASYYPDPNVSWVASTPQFVTTTSQAASANAPNLAFQPDMSQVWRKLPKKTKVVQSAWCEVCKINCNSKDVLDQHKLGKKHIKNLQKLQAPTPPVAAPTVAAPVVAAPSSTNIVVPPNSNAAPPPSISTSTSLPAPVPTPTPPSTDKPFIGPQPKSKSKKARKKTATRGEDLETKRRKVLEGGAAATAVRICSICNVICNSDTVFNYHIAGQKHATMAKKLAAGGGV